MKKGSDGSVSLGHTEIILSIFLYQRLSGKLPFHPMLKNRIPISWAISQNPYEISSDTQSPEEKLLEPKNWCFSKWFEEIDVQRQRKQRTEHDLLCL